MILKNKHKLIGKFNNKREAIKIFRGKSLVYQKCISDKYCYIKENISILPSSGSIIPITIKSNTNWIISIAD